MSWVTLIGGLFALLLGGGLVVVLWMAFLCWRNRPGEPRRYWASNYRTPRVRVDGASAGVENIRNLTLDQWRSLATLPVSDAGPSPYHLDASWNLDDCEQIWLVFSPYHVWISFEFPRPGDDGLPRHLVLSIEARFQYADAPPNGRWTYLTSVYDIYWCLATESDLFFRCMAQDKFPYPILMFPVSDMDVRSDDAQRAEARRAMLRTALETADAVGRQPRNYNYLNNSCATNTLWLGNTALGRRLGRPTYLDGLRMALRYGETGMIRLCYEANLFDTSMVPGGSFDDVCRFGDVTAQLQELLREGVAGDELSYRLRERFRQLADRR